MADAALNRTNFGTPGLISAEIDSPFTRENDIFSPIVQDELTDEPSMRLKGLRAYVTSDMKPDRQRESDRIFGRTLPFKSEFETNWRVGRALASATGYRDNPAAFYADPRFKSMGYQLPAHWDDVMQLYADLGAQFANKERTALQEQITKEQALVAERTKDPNALSQAIYKAVTRKHISTDDALILEHCGITTDSLRKVNAALNLIQDNFSTAANKDGSFSTSDKADTFEVTHEDFQGKKLAGLTETEPPLHPVASGFLSALPVGKGILREYTANQQTDSLADFFGEDHVARGIFLELVRMAGAQQRYSEQGDSLTEQTANSLKAAGLAFYNASLKRWINAVLQNRAFSAPAPQGVDATLANSRRNAMHNDLLASFDAGYSKQSDELAADSSWLFNAARIPVSVADIAGSTAGYLNPYTLSIELAATLNENINAAESNIYKTDAKEMQASFWERYGIAATQTAAAGLSVYGVGKLMQGAGILGQRYAPELTRRVLGSRPLTYAANVTESTVSESMEELAQVGVQELMEGVGAVADRQKQDSLKRLRDTFTSPEYWSATVGFGLIAGIAGYRGSRSKYPYKFGESLRELGFSKKDAAAIGNQVSDMLASGAQPEEISNLLSGKIYERILADPEKTTRKMLETAHAYAQELQMQDFAAHGVRDTLIEKAGLKNLTRNADGSVSFITLEKGEDDIPKEVEKQMSAEDFNRWLITSASQEITASVLETQALIRGEHLAQAAFNKQSEGKPPFARIAFLHDAPAEVLAQLRGSDTFNRKTLTLFGDYAVSEINRRMAAGESPKQAASAEFGSTGIPLGSLAHTAADYDKRISIAIQKGEIQSESDAKSASFMVAGRTTGDTILFLARGELEAKDVAHEWMEGFARSRYFSDPESWRSRLDALDAELNARGYTRNSIFGNTPQNERTDLDYIEALTDIAQKHWLINADALNLTDNAKHLFGEILDDVGAIQNGLAFARELSNFINSAEGQAVLGDSGALARLMDETGTHLTDLIKEADKSVPKTAAEFIQAHRDRVHTQVVSLADAKPATATPPPPDAELPESVLGVKGITQRDIQYANIFTEEGTLTTPPLTAYAAVTAPKGAGRGLIGGQAYKMPNRTIEGTARLSDLSLPKSMADADWPTLAALAATNPDADSPVCVYRHKSGKLELIGGIPAYARAKAAGQPIVHVRVYDPNDRHTRAWANNFSRAERIRSGAASVAENIAHIQTNKLSRTQARKANLIPRDANGQELPTSRAAWLLLNHASAQTISHLKSGTITTREALETIAPKVDIESFSAQAAQSSNLFSKEGTLETADAIVTTPTSSFNIRAMHASPHEFYKFSTDFMSSGTGGQWYGWGLYFTEGAAAAQKYFEGFKKKIPNPVAYQVELNVNNDDLIDWEGKVPDSVIEKLIADNPDMPDFVKRNIRGSMNGADLYRYLRKWQEGFVDNLDDAPKATSILLLKSGIKGIRHQDNKSWAGDNPYGDYHYVIFSGDDIKITAINRAGVWSMDEGWEEYNDPTASFNIRKNRRRYSGVFSIANEPLYKALLETSRDFYKQYNNLLHAGGKNPSSILQAAAKALALKNAIYNVLPKDSQPGKAINDLSAKLQSLTEAARNPYADLPNNTPGLLPNEIQRYNELIENKEKNERSAFLQTRLSNLTGQLLRSTQKSLEAYLCRKLIDSAEQAYQTLQPKLQPSGKERRGITDTATFNKAAILHDMMFWSAEKAAKESEAAENEMNKPDATEAEVSAARTRLAEIAIFGNLHEAGYEQTQKAVAQFIELIETGRARWEEVITEERAKTREQQNNLARLHPKVDASKVEKEAAKSNLLSKVARLSESLQNAVQLISSFSKIGGGVGDFFTRVRNDVANATNRVTFDTQKALRDQNAELDRILGIQRKNIVSRDLQRANFIEKTKQRVSTGIMTAGRLKKSTFKFAKGSTADGKATNAEILELAALRDSDRQAFIARMKKIQNRPGAKMDGEDDANNTHPYDQALDLALEHIKDKNYKGGEVFISVENGRGSNTSYEIELTAQQIADLVLRSEQPSYQNKYDEKGNLIERGAFDNAGFTEEVITKLHDYLDKNYKGLMNYAYWMRDYLNTTGLFEAYEKYMGIPFPKEENYWPSSFNSPNEISNLNALAADYQGGGVYQMLIKRKKHTFDPKTTPSLEDVFSHAINMHYTYIHVSPITREMRAFLRDPDTRTRLASISGQQSVQLLTKALDMLDAMPAVQNIADRSLTNWTGKILGGVARLALTANPVTWLKNTSGLINATVDKDLNVFSVLPKAILTPLGLAGPMTPQKILELDAFKIRYNRESLTNNARKLGENETQSRLSYIPIGSAIVLERIDAYANAASMAVLYNHHYKAARNVYHQIYGKDIPPHIDEEAHRIAENAVAVALHQNSQPLELHDKALAFQNKTSGVMFMSFMKSEALIKMGAAYMSAKEELNKMPSNATALQRKVIYAKAAWSYYRILASGSYFNQGVLMLIAMFTDAAPDMDEDEFLPWLIGNTIVAALGLGYFSAIPYLGEMSSTAVSGSLQLLGNLTDVDLLKKTPGAANVASTGLQLITGRQLVNLGKAFEDSGNTGADLLHLANAIRLFGIGAAILFPRTNQALTIGEEILGGVNALFTFARPELQRIKNQEKKEKKRKKKPTTTREEIHRQLGIQ